MVSSPHSERVGAVLHIHRDALKGVKCQESDLNSLLRDPGSLSPHPCAVFLPRTSKVPDDAAPGTWSWAQALRNKPQPRVLMGPSGAEGLCILLP